MTTPNPANSPLIFYLFGPFSVRLNGIPLPQLRSRKGHWLLALLILRCPAEVERSWLAGTLWPDSGEATALGNLRMSLKDLRRALGPEKSRLRSPTPHTLSLDLEGAAVNVTAFDAAMARGDPASLEEAMALYRGPLLEGWDEEWVFPARESREQGYLTALETLAIQALGTGEPAVAERYLRRLIAVNPLQETAHRRLMEAQAAERNYAAATQIYRDLRLLLHRELNAAPAPETTALYQQIREAARRPTPARPQPPLDPLLAAPAVVLSPTIPRHSAPVSPTLPPSAAVRPPSLWIPVTASHNLQLQPTRFIGRQQEMADVQAAAGRGAAGDAHGSRRGGQDPPRPPGGGCSPGGIP